MDSLTDSSLLKPANCKGETRQHVTAVRLPTLHCVCVNMSSKRLFWELGNQPWSPVSTGAVKTLVRNWSADFITLRRVTLHVPALVASRTSLGTTTMKETLPPRAASSGESVSASLGHPSSFPPAGAINCLLLHRGTLFINSQPVPVWCRQASSDKWPAH